MTVEMFEQVGPAHHRRGRVYHSFPEDPTMGMYVTLVEVKRIIPLITKVNLFEAKPNQVKVGTPLSCPCPMSYICGLSRELESITPMLTTMAVAVILPRILRAGRP